ncbi:MAG: Oligopeptide-binding protein AppA precursor [Firmicutes bacterium ADurb.Bin193]|nr:MAG: Oligopeptide-binding protein AppA precursor [Firmicutes bacterium ADurb.Bin193]
MKRLLVLFLAAVFLSGCMGNTPSGKVKRSDDERYTPKYGGTLKIYSYNPDTFNPLYTRNKANAQMLMLIYDTLIKCDESQMVHPVLASDYSVSDDGLVWTVMIKNGVLWHDGTPFTAEDAAATLIAVKESPHKSPYAPALYNAGKIEATGDSVIITLKEPQTNFINLLEIPMVKKSDTAVYDNFKPLGTGQYVFTEKTHKKIYLTSNKGWWKGADPFIENVEVLLLPDKETSVYAFEAREIDVVTTDLLNWREFSGSSEIKSAEYSSGSYNFLAFNLENRFLSNPDIRKAVAHAIDKSRIFKEVLLSHGSLTDTFLNPKWWVYNDDAIKYAYDPGLSVDIIKQQNLSPKDITLELLVNNDNEMKLSVAEIIKQELEEIGIAVRVSAVEWQTFVSRANSGAYDMYLGEINYSTEINPKYVLRGNPQFEPLLSLLQLQTTDSGRKDIYNKLQQEYAQLLPDIPLYFDVEALLYNSKILGDISPLRTNMFNDVHKWFIEYE